MTNPETASAASNTAMLDACREFLAARLAALVDPRTGPWPGAQPVSFGEFLRAAFDLRSASGARRGFDLARSLTASKLKLVDDEDLEFSIELGEIGRRLSESCERELDKLSRRVGFLLGVEEPEPAELPGGPESICEALRGLCEARGGTLAERAALLARLEQELAAELPLVYAELNERLVRANVLPTIPPRARRAEPGPARAGAEARANADALAQLQRAMLQRQAGATAMSPAAAGGAALPAAPGVPGAAVDMGRVVSLLTGLQRRVEQLPAAQDAPHGNVLHALKAGSLGHSIRGLDAAALDIVAMLFDGIFDDASIPDAIKAGIGRLQIPILKVAMLDPTFFSEKQHPARQLLDGIARAAVGLPAAVDREHPVCRAVSDSVARVQSEFEGDLTVFGQALAELDKGIARQESAAEHASGRYTGLVRELERKEAAAEIAQAVVREAQPDKAPRAVREFLETHWAAALAAAHLAHGEASESWQRLRSVPAELIASVQPKPSRDERKAMLGRLPDLLRRLNEGLDLGAVAAQAREPFMEELVRLHAAAIKSGAATGPSGAEPAPAVYRTRPASGPARLTLSRAAREDAEVVSLRLEGGGADRAPASAGVRRGDWVEFRLPDDTRACGRLSWVSPERGTLLFTNPEWQRAISVSPAAMAVQLAGGDARVVSEDSFFDRAARAALGNVGDAGNVGGVSGT